MRLLLLRSLLLLLVQLLRVLLIVLLHIFIVLFLRLLVLFLQILHVTEPTNTNLLLLLADVLPQLANLLGDLGNRVIYDEPKKALLPGCAALISARFA